jgi:16S rRNA (cytosine1402-N4)-methyltransferase
MFEHTTVLLEEGVAALNIKPDGIYVDCTLGGAGHSERIAEQLGDGGRLIAFDQDDWALEHARTRLAPYMDKVTLVRSNFRALAEELAKLGIGAVDGVLFDLGVSSPQLDEGERGFSYQHDAPLDMRMDTQSDLTAYQIVNEWSEQEITRILREYGEEKFARNIARKIGEARAKRPVATTTELAELVKAGIPAATRRTGGHPAKRSFQAIRIAVNDELGALRAAIDQAIHVARPGGGRIAAITFHSLEDRIVKQAFVHEVQHCICPPDFPICVCGKPGLLRLVSHKGILPSPAELAANPRARSARLRIAERI